MKTRKIEGLVYRWEDDFGRKKDAKDEVNSFRKKGYKARRVKVKGGYAVYSHKKR